jgi:hypothetical protein
MPWRKPDATEFIYKRTVQPQPTLGALLPVLTEILEWRPSCRSGSGAVDWWLERFQM